MIHESGNFGLTFDKMGDKTLLVRTNHLAFASNADSSQDVVACAHDIPNASLVELGNHLGRGALQLILKDDKACEFQVALSFSACQLLHFHPA